MNAIETHGLCKHYGSGATAVRALDEVDFVAERGEFVAIMGPSGSGKSTLLHVLGGLEAPTSGEVTVAGRRVDGADDRDLTRLRRGHLGFIFQFFNLLPSLSATENVFLPALIARDRTGDMEERALALLERVGLGDRATHTPSELSGGQQQRVSIARALFLEPEIVLADEPTGNLDSRSGGEVLAILRDIASVDGRTVVMVTHDPAAAAIADRVVFLRDGRIAGGMESASTRQVAEGLAALTADPAAVA
jgi:putative ABC transport system ATP-binding protein